MANKILILSIVLVFILNSLVTVSCTSNYVVCGDGISACETGKICCKKGTGYRCCPDYLCCCQNGTYCCPCSDIKGPKAFLPISYEERASLPTLMVKDDSLALSIVRFSESKIILKGAIYKNITEVIEADKNKEINTNALIGSLVVLDAFLNKTGYYNYARQTAMCKEEVFDIVSDLMKTISIVRNQTLIEDTTEFLYQLSSSLSELFYHSRETLINCKWVEEEFISVLKLVSDYFLNLYDNIKNMKTEIISDFIQVYSDFLAGEYQKCGETLGMIVQKLLVSV